MASGAVGPGTAELPRGSQPRGCWGLRLGDTLASEFSVNCFALIALHAKAALCSLGFSGWAAITVTCPLC